MQRGAVVTKGILVRVGAARSRELTVVPHRIGAKGVIVETPIEAKPVPGMHMAPQVGWR